MTSDNLSALIACLEILVREIVREELASIEAQRPCSVCHSRPPSQPYINCPRFDCPYYAVALSKGEHTTT